MGNEDKKRSWINVLLVFIVALLISSFSVGYSALKADLSISGRVDYETSTVGERARLKKQTNTDYSYSYLDGPLLNTQIESIRYETTNKVPADALGSWDVSDDNSGNIMAWYFDTDGDKKYELVIGSRKSKVLSPTDMSNSYSYLVRLESIDFTNFEPSEGITSMKNMFFTCGWLESIDLSSFDTSKVTDMSGMFKSCESLTSLTFGDNFKTSEVTDMSWMFEGCTHLPSLDVSKFDTAKVTDMSWMFAECYLITSFDLTNFNTAKVTDMNDMFYSCKALVTLDLSTFNTSKVTNMDSMFKECSKLTTIYASNSFVTTSVSYSDDMFNSCTSLKGGNNTSFNSSYTNKTYARIDKSGTPGYFTLKA